MAVLSTVQNVKKLNLNMVQDTSTFEAMIESNQINNDELYFVAGDLYDTDIDLEDVQINGTSVLQTASDGDGNIVNLITKTAYNASSNPLATIQDITENSATTKDIETYFTWNEF